MRLRRIVEIMKTGKTLSGRHSPWSQAAVFISGYICWVREEWVMVMGPPSQDDAQAP